MSQYAVLKVALGPVAYKAFVRAKREERDDFRLRVTDYEIERNLEVAWLIAAPGSTTLS